VPPRVRFILVRLLLKTIKFEKLSRKLQDHAFFVYRASLGILSTWI
jgi:hypothetical protein